MPMMPTKLTTIPTSTIPMRPLVLAVTPRLEKAITKPRNVTTSPAKVISAILLSATKPDVLALVFQRLNLAEHRYGRDHRDRRQQQRDHAAAIEHSDAEQRERNEQCEQ